MSYTSPGLQRSGSANSDVPTLWCYTTADTMAQVAAADYFAAAWTTLHTGDRIFAECADGNTVLAVTAVGSSTVTTEQQFTPGAAALTSIPLASRTTVSSFTGSGTFDTIADAVLVAAAAKYAEVIVTQTIAFASDGASAAGESPIAKTHAAASGVVEVAGAKNELARLQASRIGATTVSTSSQSVRAIVACGTGADAGKFDVAVDNTLTQGATVTTTVTPIAYWA